MKLISAKVKNFRLLKDVTLDFSTDPKKKLTVIRAANETGKTTCLYALLWCLYGSKALPQKGHYSLYPSGTASRNGKVNVQVEIDFELELIESNDRGATSYKSGRYKMERSCVEHQPDNNNGYRETEIRKLWRSTPTGVTLLDSNETNHLIESALPESLKNVYFTDGDSAMSFIEAAASQGQKRKRVASAIESLLGLNILDSTIKHIGQVATRFSQEVDNRDYANEIESINNKILNCEDDIADWDADLALSSDNLTRLLTEHQQVVGKREEVLRLGNKEALINRQQKAKRIVEEQDKNERTIIKRLALHSYGEIASRLLLKQQIHKAQDRLNSMNRSRQLPKVNIPILEELLDRNTCFCGNDLTAKLNDGSTPKDSLRAAIENSRQSDAIQEAASSLFYSIRSILLDDIGKRWIDEYSILMQELSICSSTKKSTESDLKRIEEEIRAIDDSQLQLLTQHKNKLESEIQIERSNITRLETSIDNSSEQKREYEYKLSTLRGKLGRINNSAFNWDLSKYVKEVFVHIVDRLKHDEIEKVSKEMNRIFLSMIGQSIDNNNSLITKAQLTKEFDIVVYGPHGHRLNPDQDLNGASRRAITLAFILALTKVSEVEAPNIIDTPLGMMSGYVKQSVLTNIIMEGSQPILFLTHDEIKGVEEILEKYAGKIYTLTNPSHFPKMLVNQPKSELFSVVRCECSHRKSCKVCERKELEVTNVS